MLKTDNAVLVVVDVQGKLARMVDRSDYVIGNVAKAVRGAKALTIPVVVTEQYPEGLGPTIAEVADALESYRPITKRTFSCCGVDEFIERLGRRRQVLIVGIETHVCVYQTVMDLLAAGYEVHVLTDAVSSRDPENAAFAIQRMIDEGAKASSVEMALFELLEIARGDIFKEILAIVK
jgi:nicotinamidase-related amidase